MILVARIKSRSFSQPGHLVFSNRHHTEPFVSLMRQCTFWRLAPRSWSELEGQRPNACGDGDNRDGMCNGDTPGPSPDAINTRTFRHVAAGIDITVPEAPQPYDIRSGTDRASPTSTSADIIFGSCQNVVAKAESAKDDGPADCNRHWPSLDDAGSSSTRAGSGSGSASGAAGRQSPSLTRVSKG